MCRCFGAACPGQVLTFVLELLLTTLREPHNDIGVGWFTREVLDGRGKEPGWVQMTMCKYPVVRQVLTLVANVPNSSDAVQAAKDSVTQALACPLNYAESFLRQSVEMEVDADSVTREADGVSYEASDMDLSKLSEGMPKCLAKFAEILHGVYAGVYDDEMKALAGEKSPKDTLMDDSALGGVSPN